MAVADKIAFSAGFKSFSFLADLYIMKATAAVSNMMSVMFISIAGNRH